MDEEVLFFGWGEGVTTTSRWKLDEVWSSFSNEEVSFSIEDLSYSDEKFPLLKEENTLEVSESNEKHGPRC